jgi:hypothetical protein
MPMAKRSITLELWTIQCSVVMRIYIYIYIYADRERERERGEGQGSIAEIGFSTVAMSVEKIMCLKPNMSCDEHTNRCQTRQRIENALLTNYQKQSPKFRKEDHITLTGGVGTSR